MVTYKSLRELAQSLSRVTGYRYIAFSASINDELFIHLSDSKMIWHSANLRNNSGYWLNEAYYQVFEFLTVLPELDWSKCQFDCEEE